MKFQVSSFILGFGSAVVVVSTARRMRPAVVEIAAMFLHLGRLGRGVAERQREHAEDLWAEVEERARHLRKAKRRPKGANGEAPPPGVAHVGASSH